MISPKKVLCFLQNPFIWSMKYCIILSVQSVNKGRVIYVFTVYSRSIGSRKIPLYIQ